MLSSTARACTRPWSRAGRGGGHWRGLSCEDPKGPFTSRLRWKSDPRQGALLGAENGAGVEGPGLRSKLDATPVSKAIALEAGGPLPRALMTGLFGPSHCMLSRLVLSILVLGPGALAFISPAQPRVHPRGAAAALRVAGGPARLGRALQGLDGKHAAITGLVGPNALPGRRLPPLCMGAGAGTIEVEREQQDAAAEEPPQPLLPTSSDPEIARMVLDILQNEEMSRGIELGLDTLAWTIHGLTVRRRPNASGGGSARSAGTGPRRRTTATLFPAWFPGHAAADSFVRRCGRVRCCAGGCPTRRSTSPARRPGPRGGAAARSGRAPRWPGASRRR